MDLFPRRIPSRDTMLDAEWARKAVSTGDLQKGSKGKRDGCDADNDDDNDDVNSTCSQSIITSITSTATPTATSAVKSICVDDDDDDDDDDCTSTSTTMHVKSTILSTPSGAPTALSAASLGISSVQTTQGQNGTIAIVIILVGIVFVLPAAILIGRKFWKRRQSATTEFQEEPSNAGQSLNQGVANIGIAESEVVVASRPELTQAREDPFADPKETINNGVNVNGEEYGSLASRFERHLEEYHVNDTEIILCFEPGV
ncbi:hypothetical protein BP5796_12856 [Coleophoma crateriformis]|uniref:Uncharacterized protein n=1 Tax=Coleophoma crateriformis TaxID=565419 RepID=A0A3D8Q4N9_9HELO|nr:hypothetical protein BP5796_12856 [Coleophoma crateriformis]